MKKLIGLLFLIILVIGAIYFTVNASQYIVSQIQNISIKQDPSIKQDHHDKIYAKEMFRAINRERKQQGLDEYIWYDVLEEAADIRAQEISEKMSHERPDGTPFYTVDSEAFGENIAKGFPTVEAVMLGFMASESHRNAILSSEYTYVACSVYYVNGTYYYVQLFR